MTKPEQSDGPDGRLRRDPRRCPWCGGEKIERLKQGSGMVGQRRCKRCLCVWEPPWSRFTLVSLFVLCGIALACGVWITCVRFPDYLSGEAFREAANAGTPKEFLYPFVGPIMLVMFWLGLKKALAVARGKAGRGHILEGGILTKGDDHNNNG